MLLCWPSPDQHQQMTRLPKQISIEEWIIWIILVWPKNSWLMTFSSTEMNLDNIKYFFQWKKDSEEALQPSLVLCTTLFASAATSSPPAASRSSEVCVTPIIFHLPPCFPFSMYTTLIWVQSWGEIDGSVCHLCLFFFSGGEHRHTTCVWLRHRDNLRTDLPKNRTRI